MVPQLPDPWFSGRAGQPVWVEVEGVINLDASKEHPVLTASKVKVIQQPEDPYL